MSFAVLTTLWGPLQLWAEQLPLHTVMQPIRMLSIVQWEKLARILEEFNILSVYNIYSYYIVLVVIITLLIAISFNSLI